MKKTRLADISLEFAGRVRTPTCAVPPSVLPLFN
jgi:hypothetical protein